MRLRSSRFVVSALCRTFVFGIALSLGTTFADAQHSQPSVDGNTVLARGTGGVVVTVSDVLSDAQRAPEQSRRAMMANPETLRQAASNLLVRRVLAKEAERDGMAKDILVAAALVIARDRVLSDVRLSMLDAQNAPGSAALEAYAKDIYKVNPEKFERPAQTRVRHILLANTDADSRQKAQGILDQLRAGASFEALAKSYSKDPGSAARGGDLGFFSAGQMVRPFEDAVSKLVNPGDLSEPVESQFGFHIIRLEERREKGTFAYEDVRAQLLEESRNGLINESRAQKVLSMSKDFVFERANIDALAKSNAQ